MVKEKENNGEKLTDKKQNVDYWGNVQRVAVS